PPDDEQFRLLHSKLSAQAPPFSCSTTQVSSVMLLPSRGSQNRSCAQWAPLAQDPPTATPATHVPAPPPEGTWQTLSMHSKSFWQVPPAATSGVANVESHSGSPARLVIVVSFEQVAARSAARQASTFIWSYFDRPAFSELCMF